ncbi:SDR family NAD(P)-dependent oxidoreductase [Herbiconiux sp. P15]|uniref:SDR family NAD(P)-dependent oxidoreductase n=1 Tax=Herbiconiux liukaitaii TaxID=3342799 RepID=UPI0035BAE626
MSEKRTIVITGASSGIGAVTARHFAAEGDRVIVVGRNPERTREVAEGIGAEHLLADFASFAEVRGLAAALQERCDTIDVLLNNAGGLISERTRTVDGHDATIQTNLYSHYLLTRLLLPELHRAAAGTGPGTGETTPGRGRVITTSSVANRVGRIDLDDLDRAHHAWQGGWRAYGTAKLAVILFTKELARREGPSGIEAYSVHPGAVNTSFGATSRLIRIGNALTGSRWGITAEVGAAPLIALAAPSAVPADNGAYFDRLRADGPVAKQATDATLQRALWERSADAVGLPAE